MPFLSTVSISASQELHDKLSIEHHKYLSEFFQFNAFLIFQWYINLNTDLPVDPEQSNSNQKLNQFYA